MMRLVKIKKIPYNKPRFLDDIQRIVRVFAEHGYLILQKDAEALWEMVSEEDYCASWLVLPQKDEVLWEMVKDHWEPLV